MRECLLYQDSNGLVIQNITAFINKAILSMCSERVQCDIGNNAQFWQCLFQCAYCALRQAIGIKGFACIFRFLLFRDDRKQGNGGDTKFVYRGSLAKQFVDAEAFDARH